MRRQGARRSIQPPNHASIRHAQPQELEEKFQVEYIAGGATQNSARVAQWMLQVGRKGAARDAVVGAQAVLHSLDAAGGRQGVLRTP